MFAYISKIYRSYQTLNSCLLFVCLLFVCCLCVNIFVPRLISNLNMFYKTVRCIRIDFQKSRKIFPSWVLVPLKMANMAFCLFLRPQEICQMLQGGYACTKIFYSWNSVTLDFEGHICQIMSCEDSCCALGNFFLEKKSLFFDVNYDQK